MGFLSIPVPPLPRTRFRITHMAGIAPLLAAAADIVGRFIPDPQKKAEAQIEVMKLQMAPDMAQLDINKVEAASENVFVSGWRPALAWLCIVGLAFPYIIGPLMGIWLPEAHMPKFPIEHLENLIYALLGLGAFRTVEKIKK